MDIVSQNLPTRKYVLRWRYDYSNAPAKYGIWSRPGNTPEVQAWRQNKEGLVRASIEAKDISTKEQRTLAECDGWNFVNFQWIAVASTPALFKGSVTPLTRLVGLKLMTRESMVEVYDTGEIKVLPRSEEDKTFHYATFGR